MLEDILDFAVITLVDGGRLSMWMPTANDEDIEHAIPHHQALKLVACCIQNFNKWSRRLLTYVRLSDEEVGELKPRVRKEVVGRKADELNNFRRKVCYSLIDEVGEVMLIMGSISRAFKKLEMGPRDRVPRSSLSICSYKASCCRPDRMAAAIGMSKYVQNKHLSRHQNEYTSNA